MSGDESFSSLASKIRSLDLEPGEAAALRAILVRARDGGNPDVEGFGFEVGSLGFNAGGAGFKGTDEELQAFSRDVHGFKGSDEELQALIDWSTRG